MCQSIRRVLAPSDSFSFAAFSLMIWGEGGVNVTPTRGVMRTLHLNETPHCEFVVGGVQRSLYIQLLSLLPWQGKERKSSTAAISPRAAFKSHRCHGDGPSKDDCAVRQAGRKGRRDVFFVFFFFSFFFSPPSAAPALLCQRLAASAPSIHLSGMNSGACRGMCNHVGHGATGGGENTRLGCLSRR